MLLSKHYIKFKVFYVNSIILNFTWIRGHTDIEGNERADHLTKEASNLGLNESMYDLIPVSFIKKYFNLQSVEE